MAPVRGRAGGDLLEHQKLGAVQVPDHRNSRCHPPRCLVQRRQVMQVKDVGVRCARVGQRYDPGVDMALVLLVIDAGEAPVDGAGTVFVGRMHRCIAGLEVDGANVEPVEEGLGVAEIGSGRARHERDVPAARSQLERERALDVSRAAARKEHQTTDNAHIIRLGAGCPAPSIDVRCSPYGRARQPISVAPL